MVKIKIRTSTFLIQFTTNGYTLLKEVVAKNKETQKEYISTVPIGFFNKLESLFDKLVKASLSKEDVTTLKQMLDVINECKSALNKLYESHPLMQEMMRKFWEDVILHLLSRFTSLQRDTAEQRYLELLNKPELLQSIPQKYLASFIGVTPTSLSRIKKNIKK